MKITILFSLLILLGAGCASISSETPTAESFTTSSVSNGGHMNLSGKGLTEMPKDLLSKTHLVDLDISYNAITGALPAEIRHLKNLKTLRANNNLMTGIPAEIGQLSQIEMLDFSHNHLTGIPHEIGNLSKLKILDLRGNAISRTDLAVLRNKLSSTEILIDAPR